MLCHIILSIDIGVQMSDVRPDARKALRKCLQLSWRRYSGTVLYTWAGAGRCPVLQRLERKNQPTQVIEYVLKDDL